jgi:F-box-like
MRHLRRLLDKPSRKSQENGTSIYDYPYCPINTLLVGTPGVTTVDLRLPTELIVQIINNISERRDLAYLCQVSKLLKAIAEPLLYGRIEINLTSDDYPLQPTANDLCTHKMLTLYKGVTSWLPTMLRWLPTFAFICPIGRSAPSAEANLWIQQH